MTAEKEAKPGTLVDPSMEPQAVPEGDDPSAPIVGRWFWYTRVEHKCVRKKWKDVKVRTLACVTALGSNYAEMTTVREDPGHYDDPEGGRERIHLDKFQSCCVREFDAEAIIAREVARHKGTAQKLLGVVKEITARLFVAPEGIAAPRAATGTAIVTLQNAADPKEYKKALVKAKEKSLPDLFKKIEHEHRQMAKWMKAPLIPMKAHAAGNNTIVKSIERRIFNVELYAGLVEEIVQVREGDPAPAHEKIRLMQRRHYMDEECLAHYETGGMDFKSIGAFDKWLARKDNLDRLLPFPRCVLAFRVRRTAKDYDGEHTSWRSFINFQIGEARAYREANEKTYLYMRNGEQLFRLETEIEFRKQLFPDTRESVFSMREPLYAKYNDVSDIITESDFLQRKARSALAHEQWEAATATCPHCAKRRKEDAGRFGEKAEDIGCYGDPGRKGHGDRPKGKGDLGYRRVSAEWTHFDDVMKHLASEGEAYNRIVLVLQGVLDRTPTFNPHRPARLYGPDFAEHVELLFDESRALSPADKPDFEAYRAEKNASLKVGSLTVGQFEAWVKREKAKDELAERKRRYRRDSGDGPGTIARVIKLTGRGSNRRATFAWDREPSWRTEDRYRSLGQEAPRIYMTFTCKVSELLSVDAYKPGEFKRFFANPHTRTQYMQWAPFLLTAEEYHAGNRTASEPPERALRVPDEDAQWRRSRARKLLALSGRAVRSLRVIANKGMTEKGKSWPKGTLFRAHKLHGDSFGLTRINEKGERLKSDPKAGDTYVRGISSRDFELAPEIPDAPEET